MALMKKVDAIKLFGNGQKTAKAVRVSKSSVSKWPEILPNRIADRVIAAACRQRIPIPEHLLADCPTESSHD